MICAYIQRLSKTENTSQIKKMGGLFPPLKTSEQHTCQSDARNA